MAKTKSPSEYAAYPQADKAYTVERDAGVCAACGGFGPYRFEPVINDKLAAEWKLNKAEQHAFSARESMFCAFCGCSYRLRALARAISLYVAPGSDVSLQQLIEDGYFDKLKVAEINSCGVLHEILKAIPGLVYSEYGSKDAAVPAEDLSALSYKNASFDLVLTSDTLEHVPDPARALKEIARVLKPTGAHIFTVPLRLDRPTVQRTSIKHSKTVHNEAPSFHGSGEPDYLVWNEFGADFILLTDEVFGEATAYFLNPLNLKDPSSVLVASLGPHPTPTQSVGLEPKLDMKKQVEQMRNLLLKLQLTSDHAQNLEAINASLQLHADGISDQLEAAKQTIERIENSRTYRLAHKARHTLRVIKRKR